MLASLLKAFGVYAVYERWLINQVKKGQMPEHVGVILDGNRRWATEKVGRPLEGHKYGAITGERFLEWCLDLGIKTVTIYALSTENLSRSEAELDSILRVIEDEALKLAYDERIHKNQVKVKAIGRLDLLPSRLRLIIKQVEDATKDYDRHYLNIALAYGGRAEIIDATRKIVEDSKAGIIHVDLIDENLFRKYLYTAHLPNPYPDLIIRTSGEERLSGFLLFQAAYSEFCFLDVYWPAFRKIDLLRAIRIYQGRKRRFGK
jgi:tritrans,polycis-undecaprenyl-diphosphate synthase [geranylgeranyl-diphosphate specific]